jgi:hypothetical protein
VTAAADAQNSPSPPSTSRIALVRQLMDAMEYGTGLEAVKLPQGGILPAGGAPIDEGLFLKRYKEFFARYLSPEALRPAVAAVYASSFDDAELARVIELYRSPAGKKLLRAQPVATEALLGVTRQVLVEHADEYQALLRPDKGKARLPRQL